MDGIASKLNRVKHAIIDFVLSRRDRSVQEIGENVPFLFRSIEIENRVFSWPGIEPSSAVTPDDPSIRNLTRYRGNTRWRRTCRYRYYRCHYAPSPFLTRYCYSGRYFDSHARTPVFLSPLNARIHFAAANGGEKWHRICIAFFASRLKRRTCFFETGKLNFPFFLSFLFLFVVPLHSVVESMEIVEEKIHLADICVRVGIVARESKSDRRITGTLNDGKVIPESREVDRLDVNEGG